MKKIILLPVLFLLFMVSFAQDHSRGLVVTADSIFHFLNIEKNTFVYIDSNEHFLAEKIPDSKFSLLSGYRFQNRIPKRLLSKSIYLKFSLKNNSSYNQQFLFYPGMYFKKITLYEKTNEGKYIIKDQTGSKTGFVNLSVPAGSIQTFLIQCKPSKFEYLRLKAIVIEPGYIQNFMLELSDTFRDKKIASYILCGILLMMIMFTLVNFFLNKKIEFLYHCFFSVCMFLLIFFSSYLRRQPGWFSEFFVSYLDLALLIIGTIFYLLFTRKFLDTNNKHKKLDKILKAVSLALGFMILVYTYVYFNTDDFMLSIILENTMKIMALFIGIIFIFMSLKNNDRLMNYMAMGSGAQIFFSIISLLLIFTEKVTTSLLKSAMFYFEVGIIMTIFFFLLGLTYKNRKELVEKIKEQEAMKMEAEMKAFETKLAVINAQQEERNRISADMHDDLGAGMTSIRLFSELAKSKMGDKVIPEIEKISVSADELLNKMNAIIWSMSSSNDTLGNMVAYIRSYALEYFENTGIKCRISIPDDLPDLVVSGVIRRNVFLVVKEALNNIVKHAAATEVNIILGNEENGISLIIHDNGKGINTDNIPRFGNGLKNMKKRMEDLGIDFKIENKNGTIIRLYRDVTIS